MYFPKSQITVDLYTNGKEFVFVGTDKEYVGYYFRVSDGRYYTGRNPNDPPIEEIIIPTSEQSEDAEEGLTGAYTGDALLYLVPDVYAINANIGFDAIPPSPPKQSINLPTEEDYETTEYQRYFASKENEYKYIEIDLDQYTKFTNENSTVDYSLYRVFSLPWLISGDRKNVTNINKKTVERTQTNFSLPGFKSYFINKYDQYFRYSVGENLKTDGTEFLNARTNQPYSGLYHIHPKKGPMVGAQHTNLPHDYLIPVSGSNIEYKINKTETQRSSRRSGNY